MTQTLTVKEVQAYIQRNAFLPHENVGSGNIILSMNGASPEDDSFVYFGGKCQFDMCANIELGKYVYLATAILFTHKHIFTGTDILLKRDWESLENTKVFPKVICDDVWILHATVQAECDYIAKGVVIGNGSIVTCPIEESYSIWAGIPARRIGSRHADLC